MLPLLAQAVSVSLALVEGETPVKPTRDDASVATFLFGVVGMLLFIFFAVVVITSISRAMRRKQAEPTEPTDVSVDAWTEAGKRFGKKPRRKGS